MRRVMERLGEWEKVYAPPRKKPLYYRCSSSPVYVLGHYETACGGCDTIGSARAVYGLIQTVRDSEPSGVILAEGLLLSEDVIWTAKLGETRNLFLITDLKKCLNNVYKRREENGKDVDGVFNKELVDIRIGRINRVRARLENLGIHARRCSSDQATDLIVGYIREYLRK